MVSDWPPLRLVGDDERTIRSDEFADLPVEAREIEIVCTTGDRTPARWRGVPVPTLLELVSIPDDTTHLLVETTDGCRMCVDVLVAFDGTVATTRDGEPLIETGDHHTRLVAPELDGPRMAKGVTRIEALSLSADEDVSEYEQLPKRDDD